MTGDRAVNADACVLYILMGNVGVCSCLHSVNSLNRCSVTLSVGNSKESQSLCIPCCWDMCLFA